MILIQTFSVCTVECCDAHLSIILCYYVDKGFKLCGTEPSAPPRLGFKVRIWVMLRLEKWGILSLREEQMCAGGVTVW